MSNYFTWTTGGQKTITATGQGNCSGSAETKITVNAPPSVSLTAPSNNDTFYAPATVNMTATASDSDGSVASVKFYAGSTLLHTDTSSPYSYSWSGMSNGNYSITAVATDNQGATTTSSAASITIADPAASTVTGVSVSQSSVAVNTSVTITVTGGNPCGAVQINFNDGNAPYLPIDSLPYQTTHSWSSAGTYTITATGQGNCSGQASTQITITSLDSASGASGERNVLSRVIDRSIQSRGARAASATSVNSATSTGSTFGMAAPLTAPVTVTLDITAGANGTVTSSPSGFNCTGNDTTCTSEFEATTTVTLTATPGSGNTFLGWGGACSGTATTCEIAATAGQLVTASFGAGSSSTITYYHSDLLGSVRAISDGSGSTVARHDYFAFGEHTSPTEDDSRRYLGRERDVETGFNHLGARQYQSLWGRFVNPDPIFSTGARLNPQLWNRYSYALNGPLRYSDSSGFEPDELLMESYGVTGFAAGAFDAWVGNSFASRMQAALEDAIAQFLAGKMDPKTFLKFLPPGLGQTIKDFVQLSKDNDWKETGFAFAVTKEGGLLVVPYKVGSAGEMEYTFDMTKVTQEQLAQIKTTALVVHIHGNKSVEGPSRWDKGIDPKMTPDVQERAKTRLGATPHAVFDAKTGRLYFFGYDSVHPTSIAQGEIK